MSVVEIAREHGGVVPLAPLTHRPKLPFAQALRGDDAVRAHYAENPNDGIGVVANVAALLVIDVEHPSKKPGTPDGFATLAQLEQEIGALPTTRAHATKSSGRHLVFRVADDCEIRSAQGELRGEKIPAPGIDIVAGHALLRWPGTAGYTLAIDAPIAPLTSRWARALTLREPLRGYEPQLAERDKAERYHAAALEGAVLDLARTGAQRNCALAAIAFKLATYQPPISSAEIERHLLNACDANGSLKEHGRRACVGTIHRQIKAGRANPKQVLRVA